MQAKTSELMRVYNTHAKADNLDDPTRITSLVLRDSGSFYDDWEYGDFPFQEFSTFALLPSLTHITLNNIGGIFIYDSGAFHEIPQHASGIKHITMKRCQFSDDVLLKMIGFSRDCLESFTYRTGGLKSPDTSGCSLNPGPVWTALGRSSKTLKKLDIDFDQQRHGRDLWDDTIQDDEGAETQDTIISGQLDAVKKQKEKDGKLPKFPR